MYGGVVTFDAKTTIINDPKLAAQVLTDRNNRYAILANFMNRRLTPVEAEITSRFRQHLNPGLRRRAVVDVKFMTQEATRLSLATFFREASLKRFASLSLDPLPIAESILSQVVSEVYFGDRGIVVQPLVAELLERLSNIFGTPFSLPATVPTSANRRVRESYKLLRNVVVQLVLEGLRRQRSDYGSQMARSAVATSIPIDRIADMLIGSLLAAQRVPAAAASWLLHEVAMRPPLQREIRQFRDTAPAFGVTSTSKNNDARVEACLPPTIGATMETLRLHPPTWMVRRTTTDRVQLGQYTFDKNHNLIISPYVIHRDEELFPDPFVFRPERWADPSLDAHLFAFGRGLRRCPGAHLGMAMLTGFIQQVVEDWDLTHDAPWLVHPEARTTLVPGNLTITLTRRN